MAMYYLKLHFDQLKIFEDLLTNEQLGELIRAAAIYARDGAVTDVSPEIMFPYRECIASIDRSNEAYEKKVKINRENGAKGGKAKAANARKPPTKSEFMAAVSHLKKNEEIDNVDNHDALKFFEELEEADWKIGEIFISGTNALEAVIIERFAPDPTYRQSCNWSALKKICKETRGSLDDSLNIASVFWDLYSETEEGWTIGEQFFNIHQYSSAIDAFLQEKEHSER